MCSSRQVSKVNFNQIEKSKLLKMLLLFGAGYLVSCLPTKTDRLVSVPERFAIPVKQNWPPFCLKLRTLEYCISLTAYFAVFALYFKFIETQDALYSLRLFCNAFQHSFLFYRHALATQGFQWATNTIQKKVDELPATTDNRLVIIIMLQLKNGLLY